MVRETTTLGHGSNVVVTPQRLPTVKNVVVYDSTRQVENWELAWVTEKIQDSESLRRWQYRLSSLLGSKDYGDLDQKYKEWEPVEKMYRMLLLWKQKQPHGLLQLKTLADNLRDVNASHIAETFEP